MNIDLICDLVLILCGLALLVYTPVSIVRQVQEIRLKSKLLRESCGVEICEECGHAIFTEDEHFWMDSESTYLCDKCMPKGDES